MLRGFLMTWIQTSFERAEGLYARLFADWLHINFIMRTVLLLLMLWLIIFVATVIFKYVLGPLLMLIYVNVLLRAWNFLVVETMQEWIYIRHYSKGSPRFSGLYMRLTDRAKHNRAVLLGDEDAKIIRCKRMRKLGNQMMITAGIIVAMWVVAFGINQEYTAPAWAASGNAGEDTVVANGYTPPNGEGANEYEETGNDDEAETLSYEDEYIPVSPGRFLDGEVSFILTQEASEGARLRSGPGTADTVVIEMLWGDEVLIYLGHYIADADVDTLYWIRVRSRAGMEGYIASHLVVEITG